MRGSLWIYWRRGGTAVILAMPSGPLTRTPTKEPHPVLRLNSTRLCWRRSIYAMWPKRWDCVMCKCLFVFFLKRGFTVQLNQHGVSLLSASLHRSPWRQVHRWRRWGRRLVGFWKKCLKTCSWVLSGWWATHSPRCSRDCSPASLSTWRASTRSGPMFTLAV